MSEFKGTWIMMPVKMICKSCTTCERLELENYQEVQTLSSGDKLVENNLRCAHLDECVGIYHAMKRWERDRKPAEIEMEGGGSTWWNVCEECRGAVDSQDSYCRHCGAPFVKREK